MIGIYDGLMTDPTAIRDIFSHLHNDEPTRKTAEAELRGRVAAAGRPWAERGLPTRTQRDCSRPTDGMMIDWCARRPPALPSLELDPTPRQPPPRFGYSCTDTSSTGPSIAR